MSFHWPIYRLASGYIVDERGKRVFDGSWRAYPKQPAPFASSVDAEAWLEAIDARGNVR